MCWLSVIVCWFVVLIVDSRAATLPFLFVSDLNYVATQLHLSSILRCSVVSWMENVCIMNLEILFEFQRNIPIT